MAFEKLLTKPSLVAVVLVVLIAILILYVNACFSASPLDNIPGPWYTRYTRLPLKLSIITGERCYYTHNLHQKYGSIVRVSPDEVSAVDEESFKRIYSFSNGFRKAQWYDDLNLFPKQNMFSTTDVKFHATRRRIMARPFSKSVLRSEWEIIIKSTAQEGVRKLLEDIEANGKGDVLRWFTYTAADASATIMFGDSFDHLAKAQKSDFLISVEKCMQGTGMSYEFPLARKLVKYLPIRSLRMFFIPGEILLEHGKIAVTNARENTGKRTMFTEVLAKEGPALDDVDILCEAAGQLIAGTDTTSTTVTYLIWAVLSQPDIQRKLEREVSELPEDFNEAKLEELPFLNAVIDETLRLFTPVPGGLPRVVPREGVSLSGKFIPGGTVISSQCYTPHRDPMVYKDPMKFDPNRWLDGLNKTQLMYYPFGAGARICIGQNLAMMQLRYMVATLFKAVPGQLKLSSSVTDASMKFEDYVLIKPVARKCEVELMGC